MSDENFGLIQNDVHPTFRPCLTPPRSLPAWGGVHYQTRLPERITPSSHRIPPSAAWGGKWRLGMTSNAGSEHGSMEASSAVAERGGIQRGKCT